MDKFNFDEPKNIITEIPIEEENKLKQEPFNYEIFNNSYERKEIFEFTEKIIKYIKENQIENIILPDRSARPIYVAINEYFKNKIYDLEKPTIYFTNPNGFIFDGSKSGKDIPRLFFKQLIHDGVNENYYILRSEEKVKKNFEETYPNLLKEKDSPLLIIDTCIHTGSSVKLIKDILEKLGFSKIKIAVIDASRIEKSCIIKPDLIVSNGASINNCNPFGEDLATSKTTSSVVSRIDKRTKMEYTKQLRRELKEIIKEHLKK